jgi:hypothetical protein
MRISDCVLGLSAIRISHDLVLKTKQNDQTCHSHHKDAVHSANISANHHMVHFIQLNNDWGKGTIRWIMRTTQKRYPSVARNNRMSTSRLLQDKVDAMIKHLASLSTNRLIVSFAPKTLAYSLLKRIGELFPGPSKATRAYLHKEEDVEAALEAAGFKVTKKEMTATQFYFSRLFEAKRV